MSTTDPERFVEFVGREAGPALRLVLVCEPESHRVAYAREDLQEQYRTTEIADLAAYIREATAAEIPDSISSVIGDLDAVVLCYESAVGVLFPVGDARVLASLDPTAASQLHEFAHSCQAFLDEMP
jgi:hypothetical protein